MIQGMKSSTSTFKYIQCRYQHFICPDASSRYESFTVALPAILCGHIFALNKLFNIYNNIQQKQYIKL